MVGVGSGAEAVPVTTTLDGLKLGVTYHYRFVAENEVGIGIGEDETLTTVPPAAVDGTSATEVHSTRSNIACKDRPAWSRHAFLLRVWDPGLSGQSFRLHGYPGSARRGRRRRRNRS